MKVETAIMKCSFLLLFFLTVFKLVQAQSEIFIPASDTAYIAGPSSIFSNVSNEGTLITGNNTLYFYGARWKNGEKADLPGGGIFSFSGKQTQWISGGYHYSGNKGPSFPSLFIDNPHGIFLEDLNDLHIRNQLHFRNGSLFLNGWDLLVDSTITGYTHNRFIVTGEHVGGGHLYREANNFGDLVFPIGTNKDSYSPLAVKINDSQKKVIGARVFNHVYAQALSGHALDSNHVMKTWQLLWRSLPDQTTLSLQHDQSDEGFLFSKMRDSSFITVYQPTSGTWDKDSASNPVISPGILTTEDPVLNTYLNRRMLYSHPSPSDSVYWLSVASASNQYGCPLLQFNLWKASRYNYKWVQIFWRTQYEVNVSQYEVQMRQDTAKDFISIATLPSENYNGNSDALLYYYYADENNYSGTSYYRLKIISPSGCITYSDVQEVAPGFNISVWPNPVSDYLNIKVYVIDYPLTFQLINNLGQVVKSFSILRQGAADIKTLPEGTYYLIVRSPQKDDKKIAAIKIVIQHTH